MFHKNEYIERRKQLATQFNSGILLFLGNEESPMNFFDNTYHFRQDSTFLYYFGIQEPGLNAIIDIDEDKVILFGDEMSMDAIVWMGRQKTLRAKADDSGITLVSPAVQLETYIASAKGRKVHFLPPYRAEAKIKLAGLLNLNINQLNEAVSVPFIKAVVAQRSVKSAVELVELDRASEISADMHLKAMQMARPGMTENEIAAAVHQVALNAGGQLSYPIILSVDGHILHNHSHRNTLKEGDMVLNDSGAETPMGYAGDLTRTFPAGKKFLPAQKDAYNIVLHAYQEAVKALKPGVRYIDIHYKSCLSLAEGLKSLGLMKGNLEDAVGQGAHALFFQCGTGHMMGLDVHDMENLGEQYVGYTDELKKNTTQFGLKSLRLGKALESGYVLTIEPGLYFIPELIDQWKETNQFSEFINYDKVEEYRNFGGIRVEDDYVVTDNGSRQLGKQLAISVDEVEAIRSNAF
ncbi:aminopeptidase P family protein [Pedobacter steynii]|uniref:Xaa-Pro aminopeptidase n=1 Tax=Pedobacter steynii TaxID=430522 RepID=A0A1D7QKJ7_9SPHI|nr:aminopeptidase P family protein [Pedobacter steynii]AOM79170.1 Xaa-Pro aminopeptidase [Pedobacter steynii]